MKYIKCSDTAKMIRLALKEAVPGIKFSVTSKTYAGGASISIDYVDGPNTKQLDSLIAIFEGSYFDGMTDYKGSNYAMIDGEQVAFCSDYVFVNRSYSDSFIQKQLDRFYRQYAGNFAGENLPVATVEDYRSGNIYNFKVPMLGDPSQDFFRRELNAMLSKSSDRLELQPSPSVNKIIDLGSDGYAQAGRKLAA